MPLNSELTVAPAGAAVSSLIAASVALPVATGASLTAVMVSDSATVAEEMCVVPPVAPVRLSVAPLVMPAALDQIGAQRGRRAVVVRRRHKPQQVAGIERDRAAVVAEPSAVQLPPPLLEYCQAPLVASTV